MASLPTVPANTALTIGSLAAMGLVGFVAHIRTKLESQNLQNYSIATQVAAELVHGKSVTRLPDRSSAQA